MKQFLFIVFIVLFIWGCEKVFAQSYTVSSPDNFKYSEETDEKILFILDFSNSMNEYLGKEKKISLMLKTMSEILPYINKKTAVGLRVYGHRHGVTPYDMCKASSLLVPITTASQYEIERQLLKTHPRGMTPITYSLKKALEYDFLGFHGKKHIILLTDGGENCDESPCVWAMEMIKIRKDVKIDVIAFNMDDKDDLDQLECTALVTTGEFHTANTAAELVESLKKSLNVKKNVEAKIIINP